MGGGARRRPGVDVGGGRGDGRRRDTERRQHCGGGPDQDRDRLPRTGLLSAYGAQYRQGLTLGLQYVTKGTNRINGRPVQVTYVDDAGDPAKAVTAARDLIGQGYKIIAGSTSSGAAVQVARSRRRTASSSSAAPRPATRSPGSTATRSAPVARARRTCSRRRASSGARPAAASSSSRRTACSTGKREGRPRDPRRCRSPVSSVLVPLGVGLHAVRAAREPDEPRPALRRRPARPRPRWARTRAAGTIRGTTVATGLAERATWGSYVPGLNFLLALRRRGAEEQGQHLAQGQMKRSEPSAGRHAGRDS